MLAWLCALKNHQVVILVGAPVNKQNNQLLSVTV